MVYYILTDKGGREINEDCAGLLKDENRTEIFCAVLADGLGGHGRGEVASEMVVRNSLALWQRSVEGKGTYEDTASFLKECFQDSQDRLIEMQEKENARNQMKTTMTVVVSGGHSLQWGHIGDSRLYCFMGDKLLSRTLDHSVPQMLVASGEIKEKDIRGHEDRNRLLRVMGAPWDRTGYELSEPVKIEKRLSILLCSDGFWELIEEREMASCLKKASGPEEWLKEMEKIVRKNGKEKNMDNYTAIGICLGEERKHNREKTFLQKLIRR